MTAATDERWHTRRGWSTAHLLRPGCFTAPGPFAVSDVPAPITACGVPMPHPTPDPPSETPWCGQCSRRRDTNPTRRTA